MGIKKQLPPLTPSPPFNIEATSPWEGDCTCLCLLLCPLSLASACSCACVSRACVCPLARLGSVFLPVRVSLWVLVLRKRGMCGCMGVHQTPCGSPKWRGWALVRQPMALARGLKAPQHLKSAYLPLGLALGRPRWYCTAFRSEVSERGFR